MSETLRAVERAAAERLGEGLLAADWHREQLTLRVAPDRLVDFLRWLKEDCAPPFVQLTDICGVDGLNLGREPRFRVNYHLLAPAAGCRLRVSANAPEPAGEPVLPTVTGLWEMADWNEREVWDLMGIRFEGHPDLRRILLHEDYELGHPLRKEIPTRGKHDDNR